MDIEDFVKLAKDHITKGHIQNIRIYSGTWPSAVTFIPDEITTNIGNIFDFFQLNLKQFCNEDQYLLVYDFQVVFSEGKLCFCGLNMLIKPLSKIEEIDKAKGGTPLQVFVKGGTCELMNSAMAWKQIDQEMGITEEEDKSKKDQPKSYGNYNKFTRPSEVVRLPLQKEKTPESSSSMPSVSGRKKSGPVLFSFSHLEQETKSLQELTQTQKGGAEGSLFETQHKKDSNNGALLTQFKRQEAVLPNSRTPSPSCRRGVEDPPRFPIKGSGDHLTITV